MRRAVPPRTVAAVRGVAVLAAMVWVLAVTYQATRTITTPGDVKKIAASVNRPTVKESRVRISRSIRRYTRTQLQQLLQRLLKAASRRQLRTIAKVIGPPRERPRQPNRAVRRDTSPAPSAHANPGHANAPPASTGTPTASTPVPRPTPAAAATPTPAPADKPAVSVMVAPTVIPPLAGVTVDLPVRLCTVVAVNCDTP